MSFADFKLIGLNRFPTSLYMWGDNTNGLLGDNRTPSYFSWSKISSGGLHTVAIRSDGLLFAWGRNTEGQLGDTTTIHRSSPVQLSATISWNSVSAGLSHTVAIKGDSTLWVWGANKYGQLGDGSTVDKSSWAQVGTSSWSAISSGGNHSIGININGQLFTWGFNGSGQLGDSTIVFRSSPVQIGTGDSWLNVTAGKTHTVAIATTYKLWSWGDNTYGELGDSTTINRSSPVQIGTSSWSQVSAGGTHTAGINSTGLLLTWGYNNYGQLGLNTTYSGGYWTQVSEGLTHTLAIRNDGALFVWGRNQLGQLGTSDTINRSSPVQLGTSSWTSVDAGSSHSVAIRSDGKLFTWGSNDLGQLGNFPDPAYYSWSKITLASAANYALALRSDGTLWAWGGNGNFNLGDGTNVTKSSPTQIGASLNTSWIDIAIGSNHSMAITNENTLYTWGIGTSGQLGDLTTVASRSIPYIVGYNFKKVFGGITFSAALDLNNYLYMWGVNTDGALGDGTTINKSSPILLNTDTWSSLSINGHVLGIKTTGTLWAWGLNTNGQVGDTSIISRSSPVQIGTDSNWTQISAGTTYSLGVKNDGTLWGWGLNTSGQLGLGDTAYRSSPVQIASDTSWLAVTAGSLHSLALSTSGYLYTWGAGTSGALGDGTTLARSSPVQIGTDVYTNVQAGLTFSLAIRNDNVLFTWGLGTSGQLGAGDAITKSSPVQLDGYSVNYSSPVQIGTSSWTQVSAGDAHTLGLGSDGILYGWGRNFEAQLGGAVNTLGIAWSKVVVGPTHTLGIRFDGKLYAWGDNSSGQLGDRTITGKSSPVLVDSINRWKDITVGQGTQYFSMAVRTDGKLFAWGNNQGGQLAWLSWRQISVGTGHSLLLRSDGILYAMGTNTVGQLGDNTAANKSSPVIIGTGVGISSWSVISAGVSASAAIDIRGRLFTWGNNNLGQLGISTTANRSSPVQVLAGSWSQVSIKDYALAITTQGSIWSWGNNSNGQLGLGTTVDSKVPKLLDGTPTSYSIGFNRINDQITAPSNTAFLFPGDFTIEGWMNFSDISFVNPQCLIGMVSSTLWFDIRWYTTRWQISLNGGSGTDIGSTPAPTNNTWIHVACVRSGSSVKLYINGVSTGVTLTNSSTLGFNSVLLGIGGDGAVSPSNQFFGYISNLRIVKGQALYTNTFTPSTSPLTTSSQGISTGTVSLLTAQNATIIDNSTANSGVGFTLTPTGTPTVTQYNPFSIISSTGSTSWTSVSTGTHSLAIRSNNSLYAWGLNSTGQLGDSTTISKSSPIQLGLRSWSLIAASMTGHSLAVDTSSTLYAWGNNIYGELGLNNEFVNVSSPTQVSTTLSFTSISAGYNSSIGTTLLNNLTTAYGWGYNNYNQLATINAFTWGSAGAGSGIQINVGSNIGKLYTWGDNTYGQLGNSTTITRSSPTQVGGFLGASTYKYTVNSVLNTAFINNENLLYIVGDNTYGQLGQGDTVSRSSPVQVGTGTWSTIVVSGTGHVLAISSTGSLFSWGRNDYNELGQVDSVVANRSSPVTIGGNTDWTSVSVGNNFSMALNNVGAMYTWGRNDIGQLGKSTPLSYVSIGAGVASRNDGKLYTWGYNNFGQLGDASLANANRSAPTQVSTLALASVSWTTVSGSYNNRAGIKINNTLYVWGDNRYGQLGISEGPEINISRSQPVQILGSWTQLYVNTDNIFGIRFDNTLWGWGNNNIGQLGDGTTINRSSPVQIGSDTNWSMVVASGTGHVIALKTTGALFAWGYNQYNELGQNQRVQVNYSSPIQVGTSSWTKIGAGNNNSFAIRTDGSLWGWGRNDFGQIGTNNNTPLSWTSVAGGDSYSVAIRSDGKLFSWGLNNKGQLGLGHTVSKSAPTQIAVSTNYNLYSTFFNGTTDYLITPNNATLKLGSSNFTIEAWLYFNTIASGQQPLSDAIGTAWSWAIYTTAAGTLNYYLSSIGSSSWNIANAVLMGNIAANTWYHVALVRNGSVFTPYLNGIPGTTTTSASALFTSATGIVIGSSSGSAWFGGYISNVRILVGTALYNSTFTIPATPLTNITNTVLLTCQNNIYIDNSTANGGAGFTLTPAGTGITTSTLTPFQTTTYNYSWTQVSATLSHVLAIRTDGTLWSWGANNGGQLGQGDTINRSAPIQIGSSSWIAVGAGNDASFAIRTGSALFAWGDNTNGILGQGDTLTRSSPVQIGSSSWTSVSATQHAVGITTANTMFAWGLNTAGQLGDNTTVNKSTPTQVQVGFPSSLLVYNSATVVDNSGNSVSMTATGAPTVGSTIIPFGSTFSVNFPTNTYYTTGSLPAFGTQFTIEFWAYVTATPAGNWYWTFVGGSIPMLYFIGNGSAITSLGKVNSGGGGNFSGSVSLALNTWAHIAFTRNSSNLMTIWLNGSSVITSGDSSTYTGGAAQIGYPAGGNGGTGAGYMSNFRFVNNVCLYTTTFTPSTTALAASATSSAFTFTKASAGNSHGVAIRSDSGLFTWGSGIDGRLGNGLTTNRSFAVQIGASSWTQINAGSSWTLGVLSTGALYSWGAGANGELGNGTTSRSSPVQVGGLTTWGVLTGKTHALSITTAGALFAWGTNTTGQLGDNTVVVKSSPVGVASLTNLVLDNVSSPTQIGSSSWTQVAAGDLFTNALRAVDGGLFTWGYGINGRLGSGATTSRSSPVQVGSTSWLAISTGGTENTVALTTAYTIFSWGRNNVGQVGDASTVDKSAPVAVGAALNLNLKTDIIKDVTKIGNSSWTQISAGDFHSYAIRSGGALFSWGKNDLGQLGASDVVSRSSPVQIGASTWSVISAGYSFGAAITSAGNLQTTGLNDKGQLGTATTTNRGNFAGIGSSSWTAISAGATSSIGTTLSNITFVWGNNSTGQLGLVDTANRSSPVQLGSSLATSMYQTVYPSPTIVTTYSNTSWTQVNVGNSFAVGIDNAGRLFAWGLNSTGQLGDGTTISTMPTKSSPSQIATTASSFTFINTSSPVQINAGTSWNAIAAGGTHAVAVKSDGTLWSWGTNTFGQVGNGSTITQYIPKQVDILNSFTSVAAGNDFSAAINTNYTLWKWGYNSTSDVSSPHRSNALQIGTDSWSVISAGGNTAVIINSLGVLSGWGKITASDGFAFNLAISPITWAIGSSFTNVNAGDSFIHALDSSYGLWAFGLNSTGQLGDSTTITRSSAVQIGSLYSWSIVGGGIGGTPIGAGSLFLTGLNTSGQLGLSDAVNRSSPVQLPATTQSLFNFPVRIGISRWSAISAGFSHSMAIREDNTLWGWGLNASGQVGDITIISRSSPVQIGTLSWIAVSAGKDHTGGVRLDNTLWTWGLNTRGQLGDNTTTNRNSPVQVGTGYWNNVSVGNSHTTALADNNTLYVWGDDSYGQ